MFDRVDPELLAPLERQIAVVGGGLSQHGIPAMRALNDQLNAAAKAQQPPVEGVTSVDRRVPGSPGEPDIAVRIYQPAQRPATLPALLWIHGGGYVVGNVEGTDLTVRRLVQTVGCLVVSVEYRRAPEHPFPAPLEDCYAALKWLATHAAELGVDPRRLAIGGASAGGGLAAGLALLARDRAEVAVMFQLLIYPMLDDRNITPAGASVPDTLLWTRANNRIGWQAYLGAEPGGENVSAYASAARAVYLDELQQPDDAHLAIHQAHPGARRIKANRFDEGGTSVIGLLQFIQVDRAGGRGTGHGAARGARTEASPKDVDAPQQSGQAFGRRAVGQPAGAHVIVQANGLQPQLGRDAAGAQQLGCPVAMRDQGLPLGWAGAVGLRG